MQDRASLAQLGPQRVRAKPADDPAFIIMGAVRLGAVRGSLRPNRRHLGMRRQVPRGRRAEHSRADDQEIHDRIIPRSADGSRRLTAACSGSCQQSGRTTWSAGAHQAAATSGVHVPGATKTGSPQLPAVTLAGYLVRH